MSDDVILLLAGFVFGCGWTTIVFSLGTLARWASKND